MILAVAMLALADEPKLALAPEPGDMVVYECRRVFTDPKDDFVVDMLDRMTVRVQQRDSEGVAGYAVQLRPVRSTIDGVERKFGENEPGVSWTERRDARGVLVARSDMPVSPDFEHRLANLLTIPVSPEPGWTVRKPGWTVEWRRGDWPKLSVSVTFVEWTPQDDPAAAVVKFVSREMDVDRAMRAEGRATLQRATGWLTALEASVINAEIPGGDGDPASLRVTLKATDMRLIPDRAAKAP